MYYQDYQIGQMVNCIFLPYWWYIYIQCFISTTYLYLIYISIFFLECLLENIGKPVFHKYTADLFGSWMQVGLTQKTIGQFIHSTKYYPKIQGYFLININCRMLWATAMNGTKKCGWQKVTKMPHFLNMRIRQCIEKIHQQRNISCHYHFRYNMQMRLIWTRI